MGKRGRGQKFRRRKSRLISFKNEGWVVEKFLTSVINKDASSIEAV